MIGTTRKEGQASFDVRVSQCNPSTKGASVLMTPIRVTAATPRRGFEDIEN